MDARLYRGGTPDIKYAWDGDTTVTWSPPFGLPHKPFSPPFGAHYEAQMSGKETYAAGYPLIPSRLEPQQRALRAAKLAVGDVIQLIPVPVNHYIMSVRLDVAEPDPGMAGATVSIAGQWFRENAADPSVFDVTDSTEIDAAWTSQVGGAVPLSTPSSTVIWLLESAAAAVTGTADPSTGDVTGSAAAGYVKPLYVPPLFLTPSGKPPVRHQGGCLMLGLRVESLPTDPGITIDDMAGAVYLTTRIDGYECPGSY
jgi:hypothetical protein